jgi:cation:H+ antiporter
MSIWISLLLIVVSLVILTGGAELLIRGAVSIAKRLGVSAFFIGLTIVGFGTSTPELSTSLIAAFKGQGDIAVGNVVGSNVFNVLVILGIAALITPVAVKWREAKAEAFISLTASAAIYAALVTGGVVTRWLGVLFFLGLIAFLVRGAIEGRKATAAERAQDAALEKELETEVGLDPAKPAMGWVPALALVAAGLALLVGSSWLLVRSAVQVATALGVSELVIGLTVIAAGTSMPELVTSVVAAVRKQADISVGNILGSNIFNMLGILGLTSAIFPQAVSHQVFWYDAPVMVGASLLLIPFMRTGGRICRTEGAVFLVLYVAYAVGLYLIATGRLTLPT